MLPLAFAEEGSTHVIRSVGGPDKIRRHLESLGFVIGAGVTIVSTRDGNLIVGIKDSRIALTGSMATRILV